MTTTPTTSAEYLAALEAGRAEQEARRAAASEASHTAPDDKAEPGPYGRMALDYLDGGLGVPLPLPPGRKYPPPSGCTGHHPDPTPETVRMWATKTDHRFGNVGLRLAPEVVALDDDGPHHARGASALAALEPEAGESLPPTWRSSARTDGSGHRWYRLPANYVGADWRDRDDVDALHHGYRYAVVQPSTNPDTDPPGAPYRWFDPEGNESPRPPRLEELPVLPAAWCEVFVRRDGSHGGDGEHPAAPAPPDEVAGLLQMQRAQGPTCRRLAERLTEHLATLHALMQARTDAGRYDLPGDWGERPVNMHTAMVGALRSLVVSAARGHHGLATALEVYRAGWIDAREAVGRTDAADKFAEALRTALPDDGVEVVPDDPERDDPCAMDDWMDLHAEPHERKDGPVTDETGDGGEYIDGDLERGATASVPMGRQFVARRLAGRYRHAPGLGWLHYHAGCWHPMGADGEARLTDQAMRFGAQVAKEAVDTGADSETIKALLRYREAGRARELVIVARTDVRVHTSAGDLDAHPHLLCVANGVVDLRTGELLAHDPGLLLTRTTAARYVAGAEHPLGRGRWNVSPWL